MARTIAFDLPGYGEADSPEEFPHTVEAYAAFVGDVLAALGVRRAHLVMNDIGGTALSWAADHPEAFASSVQINIGIINQLRRWHLVGLLFRMPVLGAVGERAGRPLLGPVLWRFDVLPADARRKPAAGFGPASRHALRRMYRAVPVDVGRDLASRLAELDRPALVVWCAKDRFVPLTRADQRPAFPRARIEVLPGSGHFPHLDDPRSVARAVLPFLREQLARGRHRSDA